MTNPTTDDPDPEANARLDLNAVLFDLEDGDQLTLVYDDLTPRESTVTGTVEDADRSEWTKLDAPQGVFYVYGSGVADRERGDIDRRSHTGDGKKRHAGLFYYALRPERSTLGGDA